MKKLVLIIAISLASIHFIDANQVQIKKAEYIKKSTLCRYYAFKVANDATDDYASVWWQTVYHDAYTECLNSEMQ